MITALIPENPCSVTKHTLLSSGNRPSVPQRRDVSNSPRVLPATETRSAPSSWAARWGMSPRSASASAQLPSSGYLTAPAAGREAQRCAGSCWGVLLPPSHPQELCSPVGVWGRARGSLLPPGSGQPGGAHRLTGVSLPEGRSLNLAERSTGHLEV